MTLRAMPCLVFLCGLWACTPMAAPTGPDLAALFDQSTSADDAAVGADPDLSTSFGVDAGAGSDASFGVDAGAGSDASGSLDAAADADPGPIPCAPSCPVGFTCQRTGICAGGNSQDLRLDQKTVRITGTVTVNGAPPTVATNNCSAVVNPGQRKELILFLDKARNHRFYTDIACAAPGHAYQADLPPGVYQVRVDPLYATNLPANALGDGVVVRES